MNLKSCILTANACYKKNEKMNGKPTGIVVHSTGANNRTLKRYVQPLKSNSNYNEIMADLGTNKYGNSWNSDPVEDGRKVCVHAFIGVNDGGKVETYQTLPFDICCWGCSNAEKGSYNFNPTARIQFEICEDSLNDESYFNAAFREAIEFCAYLCKKFDIPINKISSHAEAHKEGYASDHDDCDYWLKKYGKSMDWFRSEVKKLITVPEPAPTANNASSLYLVQAGAFAKKENAADLVKNLTAKGFSPYFVFENNLFKVRTGAFKIRDNAEALEAQMKKAGFECFIVNPTQTEFSVGDTVKIKSGVTRYSDGITMKDFVKTATLYVRQVESGGKILLVSTEKVKTVYTGRVNSADVYKV